MSELFGVMTTSDDCKGIVYPMCFGIMMGGCKGTISTGSDCKGIILPW